MSKKEYIEKNRVWLSAKAGESGVMPLGGGVFYKVLGEGSAVGNSPDMGSVVTVNYKGKTIDGRVFDSSCGDVAPAFRLRELIPGWAIALQKMRVGDRWEVYIPAEQGYGKRGVPGIPGGSTLIFEIELISVS